MKLFKKMIIFFLFLAKSRAKIMIIKILASVLGTQVTFLKRNMFNWIIFLKLKYCLN